MITPNAIEAATDAQIMPERIYAVKTNGNCVVSFSTPSLSYNIEYVRADIAPALHSVSVREMSIALEPFADYANWIDANGWTAEAPKNDRICDWFGPEDFRRLIVLSSITQPAQESHDSVMVQAVGYRYWDNAEECWLLCGTDPAQLCENNEEYSKPEPLYSQAAIAALEEEVEQLSIHIARIDGAANKRAETAEASLADCQPELQRLREFEAKALVSLTDLDKALGKQNLALTECQKREARLREALELCKGRLALLLEVYPDQSDKCDHPTATRYILNRVQAAISKQGEQG